MSDEASGGSIALPARVAVLLPHPGWATDPPPVGGYHKQYLRPRGSRIAVRFNVGRLG